MTYQWTQDKPLELEQSDAVAVFLVMSGGFNFGYKF